MIFWLFYELAMILAEALIILNALQWANLISVGERKKLAATPDRIEYIEARIKQAKINSVCWLAIAVMGGYAIVDCFAFWVLKGGK